MARQRKIWLVRDAKGRGNIWNRVSNKARHFVYYGRKPSKKRRNENGFWLESDDSIDPDLLKAAGIKLEPGQGPVQLCIRLNW